MTALRPYLLGGAVGILIGAAAANPDTPPLPLVVLALATGAFAIAPVGSRGAAPRLDASGGSPPPDDGWRAYWREFARSRRFNHHLALVAVPTSPEAARNLRSSLAAHLRDVDVVWESGDAVFVLLPEADRTRAMAVLDRLRAVQPDLLPADEPALVSFPDDALTSVALLDRLRVQIDPLGTRSHVAIETISTLRAAVPAERGNGRRRH